MGKLKDILICRINLWIVLTNNKKYKLLYKVLHKVVVKKCFTFGHQIYHEHIDKI